MSTSRILANIHAASPVINPSLLACDFAHLGEEIRRVEGAGAKMLHLDIMDGHLVPNLSFGIPVVQAIRRSTELPLDVHLMISEPWKYIEPFRKAGADLLTIHIEPFLDTAQDPRPLLQKIRSLGAGVGMAVNPPAPLESITNCLDLCDLVLVMSVMAGFGGQSFMPEALERLRQVREMAGPDMLLSVDGGIQQETIGPCAEAGADIFVTGSALFSQKDYGRFLEEMTGLATSAKNLGVL